MTFTWLSTQTLHRKASQDSFRDLTYIITQALLPGSRAADIFADNLRVIYPNPNIVRTIPNALLAELRLTKAPANLVEIAYHDNYEDAMWIIENIDLIARTLVLSLTEYFGIPFIDPYR